jgi:hypothetical protein
MAKSFILIKQENMCTKLSINRRNCDLCDFNDLCDYNHRNSSTLIRETSVAAAAITAEYAPLPCGEGLGEGFSARDNRKSRNVGKGTDYVGFSADGVGKGTDYVGSSADGVGNKTHYVGSFADGVGNKTDYVGRRPELKKKQYNKKRNKNMHRKTFKTSIKGLRRFLILLIITSPVTLYSQGSGRLYAVCAGVSEYSRKSDNLKYPNQDAKEVYELLKYHAGASSLILLTDREATAENVLNSLDRLFTKTRPEDIVIFFFSGHGNAGIFFAHDRTISFKSLQEIFRKTQARRKIIFADACRAGTLRTPDKTESDGGHVGENVMLFLSSRSNQASIDSPTLKNGLFTYYLLAGLKGGADANSNRIIEAKELFDFVNAQVRTTSRDRQTPVMWGKFDNNMPVLNWNKKR